MSYVDAFKLAPKNLKSAQKKNSPGWICEYCDSENGIERARCRECNAPRKMGDQSDEGDTESDGGKFEVYW